jgi:hypothetical protein
MVGAASSRESFELRSCRSRLPCSKTAGCQQKPLPQLIDTYYMHKINRTGTNLFCIVIAKKNVDIAPASV